MALRRFHVASSNQETYGKLIVDGLNQENDTINIDLNYQPQFPSINFARPYQRNPFWFSKDGINIYRLVDSGTFNTYDIYKLHSGSAASPLPNAFSDAIVFADWREVVNDSGTLLADYSNSYCRTLSKNSWRFASGTADSIDQVVFDVPVTIDLNVLTGGGYDLYILVSEQESIMGDIFAILRDTKSPFGSTGSTWGTTTQGLVISDISEGAGTKYSMGNITSDFSSAASASIVEPIIFTGSTTQQVTSGYQFYIEDNGDMVLEFETSTSLSNMCVALVRADLPLASVKYPGGLHATGFDITYENFSYSRMELNTRTL